MASKRKISIRQTKNDIGINVSNDTFTPRSDQEMQECGFKENIAQNTPRFTPKTDHY